MKHRRSCCDDQCFVKKHLFSGIDFKVLNQKNAQMIIQTYG
jgi:hypothetical protein